MNTNNRKSTILIACLLFLASTSSAQYQCNWNTFNIGSGNIADAIYRTQATAGQTAIGKITSSSMMAFIGFWLPVPFVSITEPEGDEILQIQPHLTKLYSAQPNPFKTLTTIRYSLASQGKVSLSIYDVSGRLIKTLINEEKTTGVYNINWDKTNDRHQTVSAGIYFYKLQTSNYTATKKLLLVE